MSVFPGNQLEAELSKGTDQAAAVIVVLKELLNKHDNVIFGGDGYSEQYIIAIEVEANLVLKMASFQLNNKCNFVPMILLN